MFRRCEWITASVLTLIALLLHVLRLRYAGPLWRDEVAVVNLSTMPWRDLLTYFPHEAFPVIFPVVIRGYAVLAGQSDLGFRLLGFCCGAIGLGVVWTNAIVSRRSPPLLAISLVGLNPIFFVWGDTLRAYGIGAALVMLSFSCFAVTIVRPRSKHLWIAAAVTILSVHFLLANSIFVFAIVTSAALAQALLRRTKIAFLTILIGIGAALSIIPYLPSYADARSWDVVLRTNISLGRIYEQLASAVANPVESLIFVWAILVPLFIAAAIWLTCSKSITDSHVKALVVFCLTCCITALVGYTCFLKVLRYPTQEWYYLGIVGLTIVAMDLTLGLAAVQVYTVRLIRLILVGAILVVSLRADMATARVRLTNVDLVAHRLGQLAGPDDFVVVSPWFMGISFARYYRYSTGWSTIPPLDDLRIHRYDLFKQAMSSNNPIQPVLERAAATLKSGHRLWVVGVPYVPSRDRPTYLAPAPYDPVGWYENPYRTAWVQQLEYFVHTYASRHEIIQPASPRTSAYENIQILVAEGWR